MIRPTIAIVLLTVTLRYAVDVLAGGGAVDVSFGSDGRVLTAFQGAAAARAAAGEPGGTLVVVGDGDGEFAALVRYRQDGSLDPTFGSGGRVLTAFQGAHTVRAAVVQPDGKVVVVGDAEQEFAALVRHRQDGSLDPTFGSGGRVLTAFQGARAARVAVVQPDGRLVVVGDAEQEFAALVRYQRDGSLDPTFGSGGRVLTEFPGANAPQAAVAQGGTTLVVVGDGAPGEFAALVRYADGATATRSPPPPASISGITSPGTSPVGCPGGTSPAAIQCRADALVDAAHTALPAGSLHDSVMAMVTAARARAGTVAVQGNPRASRAALRSARRLLAHAQARLRARPRALPARARDGLLGGLEALRVDLRALSRSL